MRRWIFLLITVIFCSCIGQETFMLTDITFCASEPSDRSYDQKPDATYVQGETVWIYLEAFKFHYTEEDLMYVAAFDTLLEVYDSEGNFIGEARDNIEIPSSEKPIYIWFRFWIDTSNFKEGRYAVRITMTDASGEHAETEGTFSVVAP